VTPSNPNDSHITAALPSCCCVLTSPRSSEIFDIFTEVFGPEERTRRLRFIIGTWGFVCDNGAGCGVQATRTTLSYGSVASKADMVAVAGYFDCGYGVNPTLEAQVGTMWGRLSYRFTSVLEQLVLPMTRCLMRLNVSTYLWQGLWLVCIGSARILP
jgi:hypothetical protein